MTTENQVKRPRGRPRTIKPADLPPEDLLEAGFEPAPRRRQARQAPRASNRDTIENTRRGAMVVTGRNGEQLTRRRTQMGDPYHVPSEDIPEGWDYQWNPVTVLNQDQIEQQNLHYANGWRPVPANRHPGRWTKPGATGDIIVSGLRLEERPMALTEEALAEMEDKARRQVRDQAEILQLSKKMPPGFQMANKDQNRRFRTGGVSISIDKSMDVKPGDYQDADDSID